MFAWTGFRYHLSRLVRNGESQWISPTSGAGLDAGPVYPHRDSHRLRRALSKFGWLGRIITSDQSRNAARAGKAHHQRVPAYHEYPRDNNSPGSGFAVVLSGFAATLFLSVLL